MEAQRTHGIVDIRDFARDDGDFRSLSLKEIRDGKGSLGDFVRTGVENALKKAA